MFVDTHLTIGALVRAFPWRTGFTWALTLAETALTALVPLFIGFAIDGLLDKDPNALWTLAGLFAVLILFSVLRRVYDTRVHGTMRVELGKAMVARGAAWSISTLNARVGMGRELVAFLEETLPMVLAGITQLVIAIVVLFFFSPLLALSAAATGLVSVMVYSLFHHRFFRLSGQLNQQTEKQVVAFEKRRARPALLHFLRLRKTEVQISDTEAILYGLIFLLLLSGLLFNLWHATSTLSTSVGAIFSIISYSWDFIDGAITLPATLQSWSRLSEIMQRLNSTDTGQLPSGANL